MEPFRGPEPVCSISKKSESKQALSLIEATAQGPDAYFPTVNTPII